MLTQISSGSSHRAGVPRLLQGGALDVHPLHPLGPVGLVLADGICMLHGQCDVVEPVQEPVLHGIAQFERDLEVDRRCLERSPGDVDGDGDLQAC